MVGTGAIGGYYGAKLAAFGRDVHFLVRSHFDQILKRGIRIRSRSGDVHVPKVHGYRSTAEMGVCDLVLIALKTTANECLPQILPPLIGDDTMLLTLQNGLGNEEFLARHFGGERVIGGLCFVSLNRTEPGMIEHYGSGRVILAEFAGYPRSRTHDIAWEFKRSGVVCTVRENLALERWRKLVWNIPFNGLSVAAGGRNTAAILADPALRAEALALMDEVIAAANRCGHPLPTSTALTQMKHTETLGPYKPSSLLDFEAGRPLELEAIWGEPLRRARAAGASMPRLEQLYKTLSHLSA